MNLFPKIRSTTGYAEVKLFCTDTKTSKGRRKSARSHVDTTEDIKKEFFCELCSRSFATVSVCIMLRIDFIYRDGSIVR